MVQILSPLWSCYSRKICNAHVFMLTVDFETELITHSFPSWKVLGVRNLELDLSRSHKKLNMINTKLSWITLK